MLTIIDVVETRKSSQLCTAYTGSLAYSSVAQNYQINPVYHKLYMDRPGLSDIDPAVATDREY